MRARLQRIHKLVDLILILEEMLGVYSDPNSTTLQTRLRKGVGEVITSIGEKKQSVAEPENAQQADEEGEDEVFGESLNMSFQPY